MEEEELFYKTLFLWLTGPKTERWPWPSLTKKTLNTVLTLIYNGETANGTQKKAIRKDKLSRAIYDHFVRIGALGYLKELVDTIDLDDNIQTGFCCLLLANNTKNQFWYQRAIKTRFGFARNHYGLFLQNLFSRKQNNDYLAFSLFKEAAEIFNDPDGWNNLGWCYQQGIGIESNYKVAFYCYKKSAKQGNVDGIGNLAYCYRKGVGSYISLQKAIKWYSKVDTYKDKVAQIREKQTKRHSGYCYRQNVRDVMDIVKCDCSECRKITYGSKLFVCVTERKWYQRWKLCEQRCITIILYFRHAFGIKGIGIMIARILWRNRDEKIKLI